MAFLPFVVTLFGVDLGLIKCGRSERLVWHCWPVPDPGRPPTMDDPCILVVDVGSSSVRASLVDSAGAVWEVARRLTPPISLPGGVVELDAVALAQAVLEARAAETAAGPGGVAALGVATQRASTVVWDRADGKPIANAISWQDGRTTEQCVALRRAGVPLSPNQSASKLAYLLDRHDPARARDLCFGTIDSWVLWNLSGGALHLTDASNAFITGLVTNDAAEWDEHVLEGLRVPLDAPPDRRLNRGFGCCRGPGERSDDRRSCRGSTGLAGRAGVPRSLGGQGYLRNRRDARLRHRRVALPTNNEDHRGPFHRRPQCRWEALLGGRGRDALGRNGGRLVGQPRPARLAGAVDAVASSVQDAGGVVFVPALRGLGTPLWDLAPTVS